MGANMTLEAPGCKPGLLPFPHGLFGAQALCDLSDSNDEFIQRMGKVLHPFQHKSQDFCSLLDLSHQRLIMSNFREIATHTNHRDT